MAKRISGYKTYRTNAGDTFDWLALAMYGDETLAHEIIKFNPDHAGTIVFGANVELRLPILEGADTPETLPPWRQNEA